MPTTCSSAKSYVINPSLVNWKAYLMMYLALQLLLSKTIMCVPQPDNNGLDQQYETNPRIVSRSIRHLSGFGRLHKRTAPQPINQSYERFWRWFIAFVKKHYVEINRRLQIDYQQNQNNHSQVNPDNQKLNENYQQQQHQSPYEQGQDNQQQHQYPYQQGQDNHQQQQSPYQQGQDNQQQSPYQQDQYNQQQSPYQQAQDNQQQDPNIYIPPNPKKLVICTNVFIYVSTITSSPLLASPTDAVQADAYDANAQPITSLKTVTEAVTVISTVDVTATVYSMQTFFQSPPNTSQASSTTVLDGFTLANLSLSETPTITDFSVNNFNLELKTLTSTATSTSTISALPTASPVSNTNTQGSLTFGFVESTSSITTLSKTSTSLSTSTSLVTSALAP